MAKERALTVIDVSSDGKDSDTVKMETTCIYYGDTDNYTVEYDEIFAEDMKSHTVLRVKNGSCVHILRQGSINTELTIEKGVRHTSAYSTPYGELMVGITASSIVNLKTPEGHTLKMYYDVDFYGEVNQTKELTIIVGAELPERN